MVKVFINEGKENEVELYLDGYLKDNLDIAKKAIRNDWDMIVAIDGGEGAGKSVMAQQVALYCDPEFCMDRVVFTPREFRKAIMESKPYQSIVYDEAYTGLSSRGAMSMVNRVLVEMLAEIRQKNLFVFIVMPTFFDLDKYAALWRSRILIHVYTGARFQRGFFEFYSAPKKKLLYIKGKKFYQYGDPKPDFRGKFTKPYMLDEKEYKKKKKSTLMDREKKIADAERRKEIEAELFQRIVNPELELTHQLRAKILGIPISTYYVKLKQYKDRAELEGC